MLPTIKSYIYLAFVCTIMTTSCSSQISKDNSHAPTPPSTPEKLKEARDFDGKYEKSDSTLQFNVMITSIFQDSKGNYWFGSHGDGLCMYDGEKYTYFTVDNGLPTGTMYEFAPGPDWDVVRNINTGNKAGSIQEDQKGNIWFVNGNGHVIMYDGKEFMTMEAEEGKTLSIERSQTEWQTDQGCMWFSLPDELGVYRYNGNKLTHHMFPSPYSEAVKGVSEIYTDHGGTMWFGTMGNGTFRYDKNSFSLISKKDEMGICRAVFQDASGRIWLGNNQYSLDYIENNELHNFTEEQEQALDNEKNAGDSNILHGAQSIEQDSDGNIWFGSFGSGLYKYDGNVTHYSEVGGMPIVVVKSIYKDNSGQLLFGIGEGSVYTYDGEVFHRFDGMPIQP
ncbi:MAG: ligand-binding sensor domain-containing protein [Flavobacteriales bacterium]|jgi:ligand-binding sensor domain-containing protein